MPENTRHIRKYPKYPEIPERKQDTRKYPIIFFDTPTRPEPDPLPGILSNTRPDLTRYWKTLPAGHWPSYIVTWWLMVSPEVATEKLALSGLHLPFPLLSTRFPLCLKSSASSLCAQSQSLWCWHLTICESGGSMDPSCASSLHSLSCLFEVTCLFLCVLVRPSLVSSFALSFCGNTGVSIFCTHNSHSQEFNWFATTLIWTDNQQLQWKIDQELNSCHQQAVNTTNWNTHPTQYSTIQHSALLVVYWKHLI